PDPQRPKRTDGGVTPPSELGGSPDQPKPRILMICAHEPDLDPRIRWEAEAAAPRFDVIVLGFAGDEGGAGEAREPDFYRSIVLRRGDHGAVEYFWRLKDVAPVPLYVLFSILLMLLLPPLVLADWMVGLLTPWV